jgi:hypothetical protein
MKLMTMALTVLMVASVTSCSKAVVGTAVAGSVASSSAQAVPSSAAEAVPEKLSDACATYSADSFNQYFKQAGATAVKTQDDSTSNWYPTCKYYASGKLIGIFEVKYIPTAAEASEDALFANWQKSSPGAIMTPITIGDKAVEMTYAGNANTYAVLAIYKSGGYYNIAYFATLLGLSDDVKNAVRNEVKAAVIWSN